MTARPVRLQKKVPKTDIYTNAGKFPKLGFLPVHAALAGCEHSHCK